MTKNRKILLALLYVLLIGPILGIFAGVIRPMIDRLAGEKTGQYIGFGFGALILLFSFYLIFRYARAFIRGERTWKVWLPIALIVLFWLFMLIGELFFPH